MSHFSWNHGKYNRSIIHPPNGLPELIVNEKELQEKSVSFYSKASTFFCQLCPGNQSVLLSEVPKLSELLNKDEPELVDEEDVDCRLEIDDIPDCKVGDTVNYIRDSINKEDRIASISFDPSKIQLLFNLRFKDNDVIQTTREFIKCATDDDVTLIPQTTAEYIQQCGQIDPEQL